MRRTRLLAAVLLLVLCATGLEAASLVDPLLRFRQVRTPHFVIYFHVGEERLAARLAALVETARSEVGAAFGIEAPALTHVILADQSEQANGWATPLPRNTIFLNAAAPSGAEFIGRTDDWLRLVFTHEYTHIVHLDRSGGWARLVRGVLGRNGIAFPNMWLPQWQIEGIATFEESAITGGGRLRAGDFRAVERVAAAAGRPLSLDRASGGLVAWPDGHAAYAAGLGFHEYLASRFGESSLGQLATATSRRLPFLGTRAFRGIYGQPLGVLWREYSTQLAAVAADEGAPAQSPTRRLTLQGHVATGPRFVPPRCPTCTPEVVYASSTPERFPELRSVSTDGLRDSRVTTRYLGATAGVRERWVVFDQQEVRRSVGLYSALHVVDRLTGDVRAIAGTERLQDPDFAPRGDIVAVREHGGARDLVIAQLAGPPELPGALRARQVQVLRASEDTQFSAPRWSPDGRLVVAERRRHGALPDIVVIDGVTGEIRREWSDRDARLVTPAWRPDGQAIVCAADFDGGSFDLFELVLDGPPAASRLTRTQGALWPDVAPDGSTLVFAGYTARGYDIFTAPYTRMADTGPRMLSAGEAPPRAAAADLQPRSYRPWPTLGPTNWTPYVVMDADQTRVGGLVTGADVLGRHAWGLSASWMVTGPDVVRPLNGAAPDWSASYAYARWRPTFFGNASRQAVFRTIGTPASLSEVAGLETELQTGVHIPFVHVRRTAQVLAAIVGTDTRYRLASGDRANRTVATRFAAAYDSTERVGYAISRERGVNVGMTLDVASRALGSRANATTATLDVRGYVPGFARHQVLAFRAAGGRSRGADLARQSFSLGSVSASPSVIDFGSSALGLMRGGLEHTVGGDQLVVGNVEYRIPIAVIERGRGTWPLLLRTLHSTLFADLAQVRGVSRIGGSWTRAVGGELSVDAVAGYGLPFAASVGVSWGRDGTRPPGAQIYARVGRAF